jgi:Ca-activated chloride channel homolog
MRLFLLLWLCYSPPVIAQSPHRALREGDRNYQKKEFQAAEKAYEQAGQSPKALYNRGNAVYRQGNYADAEALFSDAATAVKDPAAKADALHNLGNARLQQRQYGKAIEAYQQALRLRPGDPDTKVNLQLAKKKLEQEQQQPQNTQQPQDGQQPQNPPPPEGDPNRQPQQSNSPSTQQPNSPQQGPRLSNEEAQRLLETAVGPEDQRNAKKYRELERPKSQPRGKKDW